MMYAGVCAYVHGICRSPQYVQNPQCVQGTKVCAGVHAVFRCPWCMEVFIV